MTANQFSGSTSRDPLTIPATEPPTPKLLQVVQEREGVLQLPAGQGEPRDGARAARRHGGGRAVQHELRHPLPAGAGQHRQVATRHITSHNVT